MKVYSENNYPKEDITEKIIRAAFAMATVLADYKPAFKLPAYAVASVIGWSRVEVGAHRWGDVVAGAALGYFVAKHFTSERIDLSSGGVGYKWKW